MKKYEQFNLNHKEGLTLNHAVNFMFYLAQEMPSIGLNYELKVTNGKEKLLLSIFYAEYFHYFMIQLSSPTAY